MKTIRALLAAAATLLWTSVQAAGPVTLIVPTPPGGGTDNFFRMLAKEAAPHLKTQVVVLNVGGAGGSIGVSRLVRSTPDGTAIAGVWTGPVTVAPHTLTVNYEPGDYIPILQMSSTPYVLCTGVEFPASDAESFLQLLKKNPDRYTFGTDGPGGLGQIAAMRVFRSRDISQRDVPFKGAGETLLALLGRQIDIYVGSIPPILPHVNSGKVKCLIATSAQRVSLLPSTASLGDLGIGQEETLLWRALLAPKGTPQKAIDELADAFTKATRSPEVKQFLEKAGEDVRIIERAELRKRIDDEYEAMGRIIKSLGISIR